MRCSKIWVGLGSWGDQSDGKVWTLKRDSFALHISNYRLQSTNRHFKNIFINYIFCLHFYFAFSFEFEFSLENDKINYARCENVEIFEYAWNKWWNICMKTLVFQRNQLPHVCVFEYSYLVISATWGKKYVLDFFKEKNNQHSHNYCCWNVDWYFTNVAKITKEKK